MIVGGFSRREDWAITLIWKSNDVLVNKLVRKFLGQTPFNQDLVADVFEILLNYKGHFKSLNDITRFLNNVTINKCRELQKKKQSREENEEALIYHFHSMEEDDIEIAEAAAHQQMLIRRQIAKIPGKSGQVFYMQYIQELSETEIAERLNISEKTVSNHLSAAYKFLRIQREDSRRYAFPVIVHFLIYLHEYL